MTAMIVTLEKKKKENPESVLSRWGSVHKSSSVSSSAAEKERERGRESVRPVQGPVLDWDPYIPINSRAMVEP